MRFAVRAATASPLTWKTTRPRERDCLAFGAVRHRAVDAAQVDMIQDIHNDFIEMVHSGHLQAKQSKSNRIESNVISSHLISSHLISSPHGSAPPCRLRPALHPSRAHTTYTRTRTRTFRPVPADLCVFVCAVCLSARLGASDRAIAEADEARPVGDVRRCNLISCVSYSTFRRPLLRSSQAPAADVCASDALLLRRARARVCAAWRGRRARLGRAVAGSARAKECAPRNQLGRSDRLRIRIATGTATNS